MATRPSANPKICSHSFSEFLTVLDMRKGSLPRRNLKLLNVLQWGARGLGAFEEHQVRKR